MSASPARSDRPVTADFVISRTFDAPRELVWKAWTEEDRLKKWFSPKGFTMFHAKNDFRIGGTFLYGLEGPQIIWGRWTFREIDPPSRLVVEQSFSDENGGMGRHPMAPTWPLKMRSVVTFEEKDGRTVVTVRWAPLDATDVETATFDAGRASMTQGWTGTLDHLEACLAKEKK